MDLESPFFAGGVSLLDLVRCVWNEDVHDGTLVDMLTIFSDFVHQANSVAGKIWRLSYEILYSTALTLGHETLIGVKNDRLLGFF